MTLFTLIINPFKLLRTFGTFSLIQEIPCWTYTIFMIPNKWTITYTLIFNSITMSRSRTLNTIHPIFSSRTYILAPIHTFIEPIHTHWFVAVSHLRGTGHAVHLSPYVLTRQAHVLLVSFHTVLGPGQTHFRLTIYLGS